MTCTHAELTPLCFWGALAAPSMCSKHAWEVGCRLMRCGCCQFQVDRAKVLSNTIKQKRKEKAGKWEVPLPKVGVQQRL